MGYEVSRITYKESVNIRDISVVMRMVVKKKCFIFKQNTAYEIRISLGGSEMFIRDRARITPSMLADIDG